MYKKKTKIAEPENQVKCKVDGKHNVPGIGDAAGTAEQEARCKMRRARPVHAEIATRSWRRKSPPAGRYGAR